MTAHRELAERIARALLTNRLSVKGVRLEIVSWADEPARSVYVGSWSGQAVAGIIESHLAELDQPSRSARARMRTLLRATVDLASGWDEYGAIGPRAPLSWESVGRVAMDHATAALRELDGLPPMIHPRVGLDDLAEDTMEEVAPIEQPDDQQPRPAALTEGGPSATPAGGLKRCPFCGSTSTYMGVTEDGSTVMCSACQAGGPVGVAYDDEDPGAEELAIAAWNRRAS